LKFRKWEVGSENWKLEAGSWKLEAGSASEYASLALLLTALPRIAEYVD
jgi:hypothetical protein